MVVDADTGDAVADPDPAIFETCVRNRGPHQVVNELLRSQIETGTRVCTSIAQLRASLYETRSIVIDGARRHGTAVIASSTHPFARWQEQRVTARRRYEEAEIAYQQGVRRFFVGGMHIHAGFGTPDLRIKVMTAIRPYLPLLLALSSSSPFYSGQLTGLKSYRQSVIATLPRTGMPGPIHSGADYEAVVRRYRQVGAIRDPGEIRWDIRPSASYPTLELRICDICPRVEDAIAIAALYGCLIRHLARRIEAHMPPPPTSEEWIEHSRWLAQRYGTLAFLPAGDPPSARRHRGQQPGTRRPARRGCGCAAMPVGTRAHRTYHPLREQRRSPGGHLSTAASGRREPRRSPQGSRRCGDRRDRTST